MTCGEARGRLSSVVPSGFTSRQRELNGGALKSPHGTAGWDETAGGRVIERMAGQRILGKSPLGVFLRFNEWLWRHLPFPARTPGLAAYGDLMYSLVRLRGDRRQWFGTYFFRNRPQLRLICRLAELRRRSPAVRIAVVGCSIGADVYSILWSIRATYPDLNVVVDAVDISDEVLEVAREGRYSRGVSELALEPIFERMTEGEIREMFDEEGERLRVKPWLREGIAWRRGDARDPGIVDELGRHDLVVANDFLCHMVPAESEKCLRNIARLVEPGGYLVVAGIDIDVRTKVAKDLWWKPVAQLMEDIHDGDRSLRQGWPWKYWGLEPFDRSRPDWRVRYASAFQLGETR
jgi:SAM-dependent methyltransferase